MSRKTTDSTQTLLTPAQVAEQLGVDVRTVKGWMRSPAIASHIVHSGRRLLLASTVIGELRRYSEQPDIAPTAAAMRLLTPHEKAMLLQCHSVGSGRTPAGARGRGYSDEQYAGMARAAYIQMGGRLATAGAA